MLRPISGQSSWLPSCVLRSAQGAAARWSGEATSRLHLSRLKHPGTVWMKGEIAVGIGSTLGIQSQFSSSLARLFMGVTLDACSTH